MCAASAGVSRTVASRVGVCVAMPTSEPPCPACRDTYGHRRLSKAASGQRPVRQGGDRTPAVAVGRPTSARRRAPPYARAPTAASSRCVRRSPSRTPARALRPTAARDAPPRPHPSGRSRAVQRRARPTAEGSRSRRRLPLPLPTQRRPILALRVTVGATQTPNLPRLMPVDNLGATLEPIAATVEPARLLRQRQKPPLRRLTQCRRFDFATAALYFRFFSLD